MGRTTDWWSYGGDAQRTGWEKNEQKFTKDDVKDFRLLWKMKLDNSQKGPGALMAPVIVGNLIGSRGFKELAIIAGSSNRLWAIDSDLARMYWHKDFGAPKKSGNRGSCRAGLTAMPTLSAPVVFHFPTTPARPSSTARKAPAGESQAAMMKRVFSPKPAYLVSSDGMLHRLNVDDGSDLEAPLAFLPANAQAHSLNVTQDAIYTSTSEGCGGSPNAVWGIDLSAAPPKVSSFVSRGAGFVGLGGAALGNDATVYAQTGAGKFDPDAHEYGNAVLALTPKDLQLKQYFAFPESASSGKTLDMNATTPLVFAYKGLDLVVAAGRDGRLYLLDSSALGGADHKTPLYQTPLISTGGIWGSLSSWQDIGGVRYVLAAVWGPLSSELKVPVTNGDAPNGSIVAFKVEEQDGKPVLTAAWASEDMQSPAPPVIAQGVVFALANGEYIRRIRKSRGSVRVEERPKNGTHAVLYALDAATGKQMYSTGDQVALPGSLTGLSIANGRLYFATTDNTMNVFGKYLQTEP